eukprot:1119931-Prorocentrum_minimum.AAC.1
MGALATGALAMGALAMGALAPLYGQGRPEHVARPSRQVVTGEVSGVSVRVSYKYTIRELWKGLWGVECILAVVGTGGPVLACLRRLTCLDRRTVHPSEREYIARQEEEVSSHSSST